MKKRFAVLMLLVCVMLGGVLLPTAASADHIAYNATNFEELIESFGKADPKAGASVSFVGEITAEDLNSYFAGTSGSRTITVPYGVYLTIKEGSSIPGNFTLVLSEACNLIVESGITFNCDLDSKADMVIISSGVTIPGKVTIDGTYGGELKGDRYANGNLATFTGKVELTNGATITGGKFMASVTVGSGCAITDGTFDDGSTGNDSMTGVINYGTISGGSFHMKVSNEIGSTISGGTFDRNRTLSNEGKITGGTFNGEVTNNADGTISGGTFSNTVANLGTLEGNAVYNKDSNYSSYIFNSNGGVIKGGTFNVPVYNSGNTGGTATGATIEGGTFNAAVDNGKLPTTQGRAVDGNKITGGTFNGTVTNHKPDIDGHNTISGGTFNGSVTNNSWITNGTFKGKVTNNPNNGGKVKGGVFWGGTDGTGWDLPYVTLYSKTDAQDSIKASYDGRNHRAVYVSPGTVLYVKDLPIPTLSEEQEGQWKFKEWVWDTSRVITSESIELKKDENMMLCAVWESSECTVKVYSQGGTFSNLDSKVTQNTDEGFVSFVLPKDTKLTESVLSQYFTLSRPCYDLSWQVKQGGTWSSFTEIASLEGDVELQACWTLAEGCGEVVFHNNANLTGSMPNQAFKKGEDFQLSACRYSVNKSYQFDHWNTKEDGKGLAYAEKATVNFNDDTVHLYAQCVDSKVEKYIALFHWKQEEDGTYSNMKAGVSSTPGCMLTLQKPSAYQTGDGTKPSDDNFVGWKRSNDSTLFKVGQSITLSSNPNDNVFYAVRKCTVTFDACGGYIGSEFVTQKTVEVNGGEKLSDTEIPNPTRPGYVFKGWYDEYDKPFDSSTVVTADVEVYAEWIPTVTFVAGTDGSFDTTADPDNDGKITVTCESGKINKSDCPTPIAKDSGREFAGWVVSGGSETLFFANGDEQDVTASITLCATWKAKTYHIVVQCKDTSGGNDIGTSTAYVMLGYISTTYTSVDAAVGQTVYLKAAAQQNSYEFKGWDSDPVKLTYKDEQNGQSFIVPALPDGKDTITITAKFQQKRYTVTLYPNGGKWEADGSTEEKKITDIAPGTFAISVWQSIPRVIRGSNEYLLQGWYEEGATSAWPGDDVLINRDVTLYARWKKLANLTYHSNYGDGAEADPFYQTVGVGVEETLFSGSYCGFGGEGRKFLCWTENADGTGKKFAQSAKFIYDGSITDLYAQWYTGDVTPPDPQDTTGVLSVTYYQNVPNGKREDFGPYPISYGAYVLKTLADLGWETPTGTTFEGWSLNSDGSGTRYQPGDEIIPNKTGKVTEIYAIWKDITYDVTFDANGGKWDENTTKQTVKVAVNTGYVSEDAVPADPTWAGYDFKGWYVDTGDSQELTQKFTSGENGTPIQNDVTIKARWERITYTVTFDPNGGYFGEDKTDTQPKNATVEYGNTATAPTAAREHYTFTGWYTAAEGGDKFDFTTAITQETREIKLYARWTQNQSTLTFEPNYTDFTGTKATQTEAEGTIAKLKPNGYQREGYDFKGWNTQADGLGTDYDDEASYSFATTASTLYAQWERITYTVTFNPNGGYFGEDKTDMQPKNATVEYGNKATAPTAAREHYTFTGWYTAAEGGELFAFDKPITQETREIKLYAQWTQNQSTLTFEPNYTNFTGTKATQTEAEGTIAKLKPNGYQREGYDFKGWNTQADGLGTDYDDKANYSFATTASSLYARWERITYTVTFNPNGGYFGEDKTDTQPKNAPVEYGNKATAPTAAREHYTFTGWYTAAEGGELFDFDKPIKQETREIKLYARWTQNQSTLTFEPNYTNFTGTKATQTEAEGTIAKLKPNGYQREGYDFKGWNTQADGLGTDYDDEANYSFATATSTLYARWERITYTVTFDPNGGYFGEGKTDTQPKNATVEYGNKATAPTVAREHYTFTGWYTAAEGGDKFDFTTAITQEAREIKLYARWTPKTYTVTFDSNGGEGAMEKQTFAYGIFQKLTANLFIYSDHTFTGWNTMPDGKGASYSGEQEISLTDDLKLYAQWKPSDKPTDEPTDTPTDTPTDEPTTNPTATPTTEPTEEPTATPTTEPTEEPTATPTTEPIEEPTATPTAEPTEEPTATPTTEPTEEPTAEPTVEPTATPEITVDPTATPTVTPMPLVIIQQPKNQSTMAGQKAVFSVQVSGENLTYQWYVNRNDGLGFVALEGATAATHTTTALTQANDNCQYYCLVSNGETSIQSDVVTLSVVADVDVPKTGDSTKLALWLTMAATSSVGLIFILSQTRRRKG